MRIITCIILSAVLLLPGIAAANPVDRVLLITSATDIYYGYYYSAAGDNSVSIMRYLGIPVDYVYLTTPGQVASALAWQSYSQIWHYDLVTPPTRADFSIDYNAISNWLQATRHNTLSLTLVTLAPTGLRQPEHQLLSPDIHPRPVPSSMREDSFHPSGTKDST